MSNFKISKENTKKMQNIGLKMIKYFDEFCTKNNLNYFLCGGSCIGAIRNKGFIEWDDDVDIFMHRSDYQKLQKIWKDTEKYIIQINTPDYPKFNSAITIHDRNSTFVKSTISDKDVAQGVAMDIFPLDNAPRGISRKLQKFWANIYIIYSVSKPPQNHGFFIKLFGSILLRLAPTIKLKYKFSKFAEKQMIKYNSYKTEYITELCAGPKYMQYDYPVDIFSKQLYVEFEDTKLPIPVGYDKYLTIAFGDYMKLPPAEQRINHHEYEFIDLDRPYLEYRKKEYFVK